MARSFDRTTPDWLYNDSPPITSSPFTMSAWYYSNEGSNNKVILSFGDKDTSGEVFLIYIASTENVFYFVAGGGGSSQTSAGLSYSLGTWAHIAGVEVATDDHRCFLNGEKQNNTQARVPSGVDRIAIGIRCDDNSSPMDGKIAEASLWNVALTDEEIGLLANGISPLLMRPQNLVMYIPLIRDDDNDLVGGLSFSITGTPGVDTHARVLYPRK